MWGSLLGLPATGKPVKIGSMHLLRFENGLATEWWGVPDLYGALQQAWAPSSSYRRAETEKPPGQGFSPNLHPGST